MEANEYQKRSKKTLKEESRNLNYLSMGLASEAGEVCGLTKKIIRDKGDKLTGEDREKYLKELGDVAWYLANLADLLNLSLDNVFQENLNKLQDRKERGVIEGSGDDR